MVTIKQAIDDLNKSELVGEDICTTEGELVILLEELQRLRDEEEQGLLLRLPCKVGDTVYALTPFCEICEEALDNTYDCEICSKGDFVTETKFDYEMIHMLGKKVFLTKEEAEQKLAEYKGE